ncbi:MAG: hypothetical protein HZB80_02910, partial [Deltaproteobacteria bacterium]|nr:hypothetical protein [Deltaproteobacteria bacterium]
NELAGLASELQTMVSRFKIGEDVGSRVKGSRGLPPQALSGGQEVKRQVGAGLKALTSGGKGAVKRQQEKDAS